MNRTKMRHQLRRALSHTYGEVTFTPYRNDYLRIDDSRA